MPDVQVRVRGFRGVPSGDGSPPGTVLEGEAHGSVDPHRLQYVLQAMEKKFVETVHRLGGHAGFESDVIYTGFHFPPDHPARVQTEAAIRAAGFQPRPVQAEGGSDANLLTSLGIPTVNIGIGLKNIHTPSEHIRLEDLVGASRVALTFCTGLDVTA
jgi:tripeptide aminopeptidase